MQAKVQAKFPWPAGKILQPLMPSARLRTAQTVETASHRATRTGYRHCKRSSCYTADCAGDFVHGRLCRRFWSKLALTSRRHRPTPRVLGRICALSRRGPFRLAEAFVLHALSIARWGVAILARAAQQRVRSQIATRTRSLNKRSRRAEVTTSRGVAWKRSGVEEP
jgi:hypothetical protein